VWDIAVCPDLRYLRERQAAPLQGLCGRGGGIVTYPIRRRHLTSSLFTITYYFLMRCVEGAAPYKDCAGGDVGGAALSAPRADVGIRPYVIYGSGKQLPYEACA